MATAQPSAVASETETERAVDSETETERAIDSETETERAVDSETETERAVDSETETECSVCHEQYTEPKLLPCAHVLCRHCLVSWLSSSGEHQCPLCRCAIFGDMETQQTDRGNLSKMVDSLPTYVTLSTLIKCMRILSQDHMCGGCQQSAAVSICLHCSEMMCSFCQNVHKRFAVSRHHKVEDLATMTAERLAASQPDYCAAHKGNPSQLFCQSHREAYCLVCATTKHRSCSSVTELEKAAGKSRDELTELLSTLLQGKESIEEAVSELDRQIDDIEKHSQRTITKIDKLFDQLENSLKTRRRRVKEEELEAKSKAKNSALAVKTLLLDRRAKLMSNHRVVSCVVKSSTDQSLCEISPSLKAQMERLNTSSDLPPHTEPVVEVTCTIDRKAIARIEQTVSELCQVTLTPTTPQSQYLHQLLMPRWSFQPKHGRFIRLSEDRMTAQRVNFETDGIVVADQAMMVNKLFEVEILSETDHSRFACGAVQETADGFTLPDTACNGWDLAVVFSDSNFICGRKIANTRKDQLRSLPKGTRVGVMLDTDRRLHLFIDGQDTDVIDCPLTSPCFAFFEFHSIFNKSYHIDASPYKNVDFHPMVKVFCAENTTGTAGLKACKAVIVGDVAVGKTCIVNRYCHDVFNRDYKATIGVDFEVEKFSVLSVPVTLQIWDTAGQERFKCIAASYYRGANVVMVAFDMTNEGSLLNAPKWMEEACKNADDPIKFLIGTKQDLLSDAAFIEVEKRSIAVANNLQAEFWPTSSKSGYNVHEFFTRMVSVVFDAQILKELDNSAAPSKQISTGTNLIQIQRDNSQYFERKKRSQCCKQ